MNALVHTEATRRATGGADSLLIFDRRIEDALNRAIEFEKKMSCIEEAKTGLSRSPEQ